MRTDGPKRPHFEPPASTEETSEPSTSGSVSSLDVSAARPSASHFGKIGDLVGLKKAASAREKAAAPAEPLDVVAVGGGYFSHFTIGHIADTRKAAPKALRVNQQSADGNVKMAIVGSSLDGVASSRSVPLSGTLRAKSFPAPPFVQGEGKSQRVMRPVKPWCERYI